jgi:hypothetical protein
VAWVRVVSDVFWRISAVFVSMSKSEQPSPSVEQLVTAFKRRGHFDTLRKSTLSSFQGGVR